MRDDMLRQLRFDECDNGIPNLVVYDDASGGSLHPGDRLIGHPTIGIGRALDVHGISPAEAEAMFVLDVQDAERELGMALPWLSSLDPVRRDVLVNMAFQMGVGGVLAFRHMLAALNAGDWEGAAVAALASRWAAEMATFGSPRATRLAEQLRTGRASATGEPSAADAVS